MSYRLPKPKEMFSITKNDKVLVKKTLTKTNSIGKSSKEPSKQIPGDTNKSKKKNDGKELNTEELKIRMKKSKDLGEKMREKSVKRNDYG